MAGRLRGGRGSLALLAVAAAATLAGLLGGSRLPPAALAGGLAALGAALGLARPVYGALAALLVALMVPFLVVPQRLGAQPPVLDVVVASTLVGTAARAVWGRRAFAARWEVTPRWLMVTVAAGAALPLFAGGAAFAAAGDVEAVQVAAKMSMYALTPLMAALVCPGRRSISALPLPVTAAAALQAAVAIVLHMAGTVGVQALEALGAAGYPSADVARFLPDQVTPRATGLLVDPNVLGVTLAAALPFGLAWVGGGARRRILGMGAVALIGMALMLTISRASWLAAAAGLLVWLALIRPRAAAAATAALGAAVLAAPLEPFERIRQGLQAGDPSAALRVDELREATRVIGRFPLLGVGYGEAPHPDIFAGVSNAWLWLAERAGIGAAMANLALLGGAAWTAVRSARSNPEVRPMLASLAAFVTAGVFDHHIVSFPHLVYLVGGLAGLLAARSCGDRRRA